MEDKVTDVKVRTTAALMFKSTHDHKGLVGSLLLVLKDGRYQNIDYCSYCQIYDAGTDRYIPPEKLATLCSSCAIPVPVLEGCHIYCDYCQKCCGSTQHTLSHSAGECKCCTSLKMGGLHMFCEICYICYPRYSGHMHGGKESRKKRVVVDREDCE